jgi:hypothetical protein
VHRKKRSEALWGKQYLSSREGESQGDMELVEGREQSCSRGKKVTQKVVWGLTK